MTRDKYRKKLKRLKRRYRKETVRYEALNPGDRIYTCSAWDNFEHEVVHVDVPNRVIVALDHSLGGREIVFRDGDVWHPEPVPTR